MTNGRQLIDEINEENFPPTFKQTVTNVFDFHLRLFNEFQQLTNLSVDQRQSNAFFSLIFVDQNFLFLLATKEFFALIREQNSKFENEKKILIDEFAEREEKFRNEIEQMKNEFEQIRNDRDVEWKTKFDYECERLQNEIQRIQNESDEQIRSLNERLQSASGESNDVFQVKFEE